MRLPESVANFQRLFVAGTFAQRIGVTFFLASANMFDCHIIIIGPSTTSAMTRASGDSPVALQRCAAAAACSILPVLKTFALEGVQS